MSDQDLDATGFVHAPIELVRELVGLYVAGGYDLDAMRQIVSFVLSALVERTLMERLTNRPCVQIGDCTLTLVQAEARIAELRALPLL